MAHWSRNEKEAAARLFARALPIKPPPKAPPPLNFLIKNINTPTNWWLKVTKSSLSSSSTLSSRQSGTVPDTHLLLQQERELSDTLSFDIFSSDDEV